MVTLSDAQLSALFSNLSKGCEKQYKPEEAALLQTLSDYYRQQSGTLPGTLADISRMTGEDLNAYAPAYETAAANADRGAMRALTWGEKVSKIVSSLLARYGKNPEAVPGGKNVYVCEICGFVYVGDDAPDICPVCKVPKLKIGKIARR
jgi:rubrerythrin